MPRSTFQPINFRLEPAAYQSIARIAESEGVSIGEVLRRAVDRFILETEEALWKAEAQRQSEAYGRAYREGRMPEVDEVQDWLEAMGARVDEPWDEDTAE